MFLESEDLGGWGQLDSQFKFDIFILNIPNIEYVFNVFSVLGGWIELFHFGADQVTPDASLEYPQGGVF